MSTLEEKQSAIRRLLALEAGDVVIHSNEYIYSGEPLIEVVGNEDPEGNIATFDLRDDFELRRSELVEAMDKERKQHAMLDGGSEQEKFWDDGFKTARDFVKNWGKK